MGHRVASIGDHWYFQDGEVPRVGPCPDCGVNVRLDRLDLLAEHHELCRSNPLTPREVEVLGLLAEGLTNKEIGKRLLFSEETIKTNVIVIRVKLNARCRTHAVAEGFRRSILK